MLDNSKKLFIGHRGARKIITENTLESIMTTFKYGATHAEIDVRKTKDGKLVLFHDPITFRFNGKFSFINQMTMEELTHLSLKLGGKITTLDNVLEHLSKTSGNLIIETKVFGLEKEILSLIDKYNFWDRAIIWSFNHESIKEFTRLCGNKIKKVILITLTPISKENILKRALDCGADFVYPVVRNLDIDFFNQKGIGVIKGYDNESNARKFLNAGGSGIITANMEMIKNLI